MNDVIDQPQKEETKPTEEIAVPEMPPTPLETLTESLHLWVKRAREIPSDDGMRVPASELPPTPLQSLTESLNNFVQKMREVPTTDDAIALPVNRDTPAQAIPAVPVTNSLSEPEMPPSPFASLKESLKLLLHKMREVPTDEGVPSIQKKETPAPILETFEQMPVSPLATLKDSLNQLFARLREVPSNEGVPEPVKIEVPVQVVDEAMPLSFFETLMEGPLNWLKRSPVKETDSPLELPPSPMESLKTDIQHWLHVLLEGRAKFSLLEKLLMFSILCMLWIGSLYIGFLPSAPSTSVSTAPAAPVVTSVPAQTAPPKHATHKHKAPAKPAVAANSTESPVVSRVPALKNSKPVIVGGIPAPVLGDFIYYAGGKLKVQWDSVGKGYTYQVYVAKKQNMKGARPVTDRALSKTEFKWAKIKGAEWLAVKAIDPTGKESAFSEPTYVGLY